MTRLLSRFPSAPRAASPATDQVARRLLVAAVVGILALFAAGCAREQPPEPQARVEVAGSVGARPVVQFNTPLQITEIATRDVVTGAGVTLADGDAVMLAYLAIDAITGEVVEDNYGDEPRILLLTRDEAGPLYDDLVGRTEGSRLLRVEPGSLTRPDPVVIVYDLLFTEAHGTPLEVSVDLPQITRDAGGVPTITLPTVPPPTSLTIAPLIRGDGPQVQSGESVTVRYVQLAWSTNELVESTWGPGTVPVTIPLIDRIPGLQDGLVDATVGSQVMLVVPPDQADGTDTMVFVIDVLAVTTLGAAGAAGSEGSG